MSVHLMRSNATDSYELLSSQSNTIHQLEVAAVASLVKGSLGTTSNGTYTSPANNSVWDYSTLSNNYINTSAIANYPHGTIARDSILAIEHIPPTELQTYTTELGNNGTGNPSTFAMLDSSAGYYDNNLNITVDHLTKFFDSGVSEDGSVPTQAKYQVEFDKTNPNFKTHYTLNSEYNSTLLTEFTDADLSTLVGTKPISVSEDVTHNLNYALGRSDTGSYGTNYTAKYAIPSTQDGSLTFTNIDDIYQPRNNNLLVDQRSDYENFSVDGDAGTYRIQTPANSAATVTFKLDGSVTTDNAKFIASPLLDRNALNSLTNTTPKSSLSLPKLLGNSEFYSLFNQSVLDTIADGYEFEITITGSNNSGYKLNPSDIVSATNSENPGSQISVSDLTLLLANFDNSDLIDNAYYMDNYVDKKHDVLFSDSSLSLNVAENGVADNLPEVSFNLTHGEKLGIDYAGTNGQLKINPGTPTTRTDLWYSSWSAISPSHVKVNYTGDNVISHGMMVNPLVDVKFTKIAVRSSAESTENIYLSHNGAVMTLLNDAGVVNNLISKDQTPVFSFDKSILDEGIDLSVWLIEAANNLIAEPNSYYGGYDDSNNFGIDLEHGITVAGKLRNLLENDTNHQSYRIKLTPKLVGDIGLYQAKDSTTNWEVTYLTTNDTYLKASSSAAFNSIDQLPKFNMDEINSINNDNPIHYSYSYQTIQNDISFGGLSDSVEVSYSFNSDMTNSKSFKIGQSNLNRTYTGLPQTTLEDVDNNQYSISTGVYTQENYKLVRVSKVSNFKVDFSPRYSVFSNVKVTINNLRQTDVYYAIQNKITGQLLGRNALDQIVILENSTITNLKSISETIVASTLGSLTLSGILTKDDLKPHKAVVQGRKLDGSWEDVSNLIDYDSLYGLLNQQNFNLTLGAPGGAGALTPVIPTIETRAEFSPLTTLNQSVNLNKQNYYITLTYDPNDVNYSIKSFESTANDLPNVTSLGNSDNYLTLVDKFNSINGNAWNTTNHSISVDSGTDNRTNFIVKRSDHGDTVFVYSKQANNTYIGTTLVYYCPKDIIKSELRMGSSLNENEYYKAFETTTYDNNILKSSLIPGIEVSVSNSNVATSGSKVSFTLKGDRVICNPVGLCSNPTSTDELGMGSSLSFKYDNGITGTGNRYSGTVSLTKYRGYNDANLGTQAYTIVRPGTAVIFAVDESSVQELKQVLTTNLYVDQLLTVNNLKNSNDETVANLNIKSVGLFSMPPSGQLLKYRVTLIGDSVQITFKNDKFTGSATNLAVGAGATAITNPKNFSETTSLKDSTVDKLFTFSGVFTPTGRRLSIGAARLKLRTQSFNHDSLSYKISLGAPYLYVYKAIHSDPQRSTWLGNPSLISNNDTEQLPPADKWVLVKTILTYEQKITGFNLGHLKIKQNPNAVVKESISYLQINPPLMVFTIVSSDNNPISPYDYNSLSETNKKTRYMTISNSANTVFNPFQPINVVKDVVGNSYDIIYDGSSVNNLKFTILNPKTIRQLTSPSNAGNNPSNADNTRYGISIPGTKLTITSNKGLNPSNSSPKIVFNGTITSIPKTLNVLTNKIVYKGREVSGAIRFSVLQFPSEIGLADDLTSYNNVFKTTNQARYYNLDFSLGNPTWHPGNNSSIYFNINSTGNRPTLYTVCNVNNPITKTNFRRIHKYTSITNIDIANTNTLQTLSLQFAGGRKFYDVEVVKPPISDTATYAWNYNTMVGDTTIGSDVNAIPWQEDNNFTDTVTLSWSFGNTVTGKGMPRELAFVSGTQKKWSYISLQPYAIFKNQFNLDVAHFNWDGSVVTPLVTTSVLTLKPVIDSPTLNDNTYQIEQYSSASLNRIN